MGGLRKHMPWTATAFLVAALSLAGIWPLSGFWSKDDVLAQAWDERRLIFYLAMATVPLTAFYIFRVYYLVFGGKYRWREHHLHESPPVMVIPMMVLAVAAIFSGWLNLGGGFARFLGEEEAARSWTFLFDVFAHPLPWIALLLASLGIFAAYAMYGARWLSPERVGRALSPIYTVLSRKYYFDELYEGVIAKRALYRGLFRGLEEMDRRGVDGAVNGVADGTLQAGAAIRRVQLGQLQLYGAVIALGLVAIFVVLYALA
ncbi:MAG: proton-conducting transporter membrane subunit [Chloroflexota bacterium]